MAYRKVNDDSLASVANAIRTKGGTTEPLAFPDGFVSAISAIQTGDGGDGDEQLFNYASGTFVPSYNANRIEITHNLGKIPCFVFVFYTGKYNITSTFENFAISFLFGTIGKQLMLRTYNNTYMIRQYSKTGFEDYNPPIVLATETNIILYDSTQDDFYMQGCEYKWIMW